MAGPALAQQPNSPATSSPTANQTLADSIANRLRATKVAAGAEVAIVAQDGTVTLTGTVRSPAQHADVVREVRGVSGVTIVRDGLKNGDVAQVQGSEPIPLPLAPVGPPPLNPVVEPAPLGIPGQYCADQGAPNLPPYAWPTYAPYNNLSRVAYPASYPYNAFPFIGPYYPFPKVPLGWRKVTLEWDDGYWYIGRNSAPHDYWRVKFW
jgi:hypothetical protein